MNRNYIKAIAAISTFLDHFAVQFFVPYTTIWLIFRILGRIAFVLFAYMIAEGFFKTKDINKYWFRLLAFALAIEIFLIVYYLVSDVNLLIEYNVIWPLVFGLTCIRLLNQEDVRKRWLMLIPVIVILILAEMLNTPYGMYGPLIILIFALYRNNIVTQFLFVLALNLIFIETPLSLVIENRFFFRYPSESWWQWFSLLGFIFIFLYNGKKGKINTKWFFYIFYPLHLGVIYLLDILF